MTQLQLKSILHYNSSTGIFTYINDNKYAMQVKAGSIAGCVSVLGYREIGIIAYNHLNKAVKDHKKSGTKMPVARNFNNYNAREKNIKHTKMPVDRNFNEPICGENGAEDLQKTIKDINKTTDTTFEKLDSLYDETKEDAIMARKEAESKYGYHINHGENI